MRERDRDRELRNYLIEAKQRSNNVEEESLKKKKTWRSNDTKEKEDLIA